MHSAKQAKSKSHHTNPAKETRFHMRCKRGANSHARWDSWEGRRQRFFSQGLAPGGGVLAVYEIIGRVSHSFRLQPVGSSYDARRTALILSYYCTRQSQNRRPEGHSRPLSINPNIR